ncbi:NAD(P)H-binding protein [Actinomadura sp. DSM 109109]|nr:NAD(P)H-binding protein [Actinomadura lepetitiana]
MTGTDGRAGRGEDVDTGPRTLLIFGAGGRLGRTLVREALSRGHRVRAVVHRADPLAPHPDLRVVRGDVHAPGTLEAHFAGIDVVLAALGSAGAARPDVSSTGARVISRLMSGNGLPRLVTVTGSGAVLPGEQVTGHHAVKRDQMMHGAPHLLADGDDHLAVLAGSDLDWTTIRVPFMTRRHDDAGGHLLSERAFHPRSTLPYRAAATAMLDLTATGSWSRSSPFVAAADAAHPAWH